MHQLIGATMLCAVAVALLLVLRARSSRHVVTLALAAVPIALALLRVPQRGKPGSRERSARGAGGSGPRDPMGLPRLFRGDGGIHRAPAHRPGLILRRP